MDACFKYCRAQEKIVSRESSLCELKELFPLTARSNVQKPLEYIPQLIIGGRSSILVLWSNYCLGNSAKIFGDIKANRYENMTTKLPLRSLLL